jgi:hypothetical protein
MQFLFKNDQKEVDPVLYFGAHWTCIFNYQITQLPNYQILGFTVAPRCAREQFEARLQHYAGKPV